MALCFASLVRSQGMPRPAASVAVPAQTAPAGTGLPVFVLHSLDDSVSVPYHLRF